MQEKEAFKRDNSGMGCCLRALRESGCMWCIMRRGMGVKPELDEVEMIRGINWCWEGNIVREGEKSEERSEKSEVRRGEGRGLKTGDGSHDGQFTHPDAGACISL